MLALIIDNHPLLHNTFFKGPFKCNSNDYQYVTSVDMRSKAPKIEVVNPRLYRVDMRGHCDSAN
jgi:hypothetical protein